MSLLGSNTAVISLGCSCQTAWQVNRNADLISSLLGEKMSRAAMPYDWLILPPPAFLSWIRSRELFPAAPADIVQHPNFHWVRHGLYFWHEFTIEGVPALDETFEATRAKFAHLFANLHLVHATSRRVFVMSNTQNNLRHVQSVTGCASFDFGPAIVRQIVATIDAMIPGNNEFVFVTHRDRIHSDAALAGYPVRVLAPDASDVFGDDGQWAGLFRDVIPQGRSIHVA